MKKNMLLCQNAVMELKDKPLTSTKQVLTVSLA